MKKAVLLLFLLSSAQRGQVSPPISDSKSSTGKAVVKGRVINSVTGEPVKNARLTLNGTNSVEASAISGFDGTFLFRELPPGNYQVTGEHPLYPYSTRVGEPAPLVRTSIVQDDEEKEVELRLRPAAAVSGIVTDEDGEPMAGASVSLLCYWYWPAPKRLVSQHHASTDSRGHYRIHSVPAGKYFLMVDFNEPVQKPRPLAPRDAVLAIPREVYAKSFYPGVTEFGQAQGIDLKPGAEIEGVDFELTRQPATQIYGKIDGPAGSWKSRGMMLMLDGKDVSLRAVHSKSSARILPNGQFRFFPVPAGSYVLETLFRSQNGTGLGATAEVEITGAPVQEVNLRLSPGRRIEGVIRADRPDDSIPEVRELSLEPVSAIVQIRPAAAMRDGGTFVLRGVLPGTYRLRASLAEPGYVKSVHLGRQEVHPGRLAVGTDAEGPLEVVIGTRFGSIEGTVSGLSETGGEPVSVIRVPADPDSILWQQGPRRVRTDGGGSFRMLDVPPGDHFVYAVAGVEDEWQVAMATDPDFLEAIRTRGETVTVREEATAQAVLTVISEKFQRSFAENMQ